MYTQHLGEIYRLLEKQGDLLEEARRLIVNELQKLSVEQEMLMRKSYDVHVQQTSAKKKKEHGGLQCNIDVREEPTLDGAAHTDTGDEAEKGIAVGDLN